MLEYWYGKAKNVAPLASVIEKLPNQYPDVAHNFHYLIKSLTYFADAEEDPMPILLFDTNWEKVKNYFLTEVPILAKNILGL